MTAKQQAALDARLGNQAPWAVAASKAGVQPATVKRWCQDKGLREAWHASRGVETLDPSGPTAGQAERLVECIARLMSLSEIADRLGVSSEQVREWMRGRTERLDRLMRDARTRRGDALFEVRGAILAMAMSGDLRAAQMVLDWQREQVADLDASVVGASEATERMLAQLVEHSKGAG